MQMCVGGRNVSGERPNATSFLGSLGALRGAAVGTDHCHQISEYIHSDRNLLLTKATLLALRG